MSVVSVEKDYDNLRLVLIAQFDASIERVWQLWADPRLLERWWGPPTYPATVEKHDLAAGGEVTYVMIGPDGETVRGWWHVTSVDPPSALEFTDRFANQDGTPDPGMPTMAVQMRLSEHDGGTRMELRFVFESSEHMRQLDGLGTFEALRQSVDQMDALLAAAAYTFDIVSTLDGYGSYSGGDWGGYWGKQGPEWLEHRLAVYGEEQRMVFGANTFRQFAELLGTSTEESDPVNTRMKNLPATVVSTTLEGPLDWPDATVVSGDAVDVVARLKQQSNVPMRSHGSLSMNRALMAAGLVDRVQVTLFPVITGQTGTDPIFQGAADFDLELIESRTFDWHIQELIYRPTLHV